MKQSYTSLKILLFLLIIPFLLNAQNADFVKDETNTLAGSQASLLEDKLKAYNDSTSTQIAIRIIASLNGQNLEEFSVDLANKLGAGQKGKDNGILILVVKNDRKIRIETGYGVEAKVTDIASSRIINNIIKPKFRDGQFYGGLDDACDAIFKLLSGEFSADDIVNQTTQPVRNTWSDDDILFLTLFIQIGLSIIYLFYGVIVPVKKRPKYLKNVLGFFVIFGPIYLLQLFLKNGLEVIYAETIPIFIFYVAAHGDGKGSGTYSSGGYSSSSSSWSSGSSWSSSSSSSSSWSSGGSSFGGGSFGGGGASGSW